MNIPFSFEFFPPKTDVGFEKLQAVSEQLNALGPDFFSVTYGAGGSSRDNTKNIVLDLHQRNINVASHLSFGGDDEASMIELINEYKNAGVSRIVALRGDIPSGMGAVKLVYANELVEFIRKHTGDHFELYVAAYPEIHPDADSYDKDIYYLKKKFEAGANAAITQYFFNADSYAYFLDNCQKEGIDQPIIPGIMPITNFQNLVRFSKNCGADIPRWLSQRIDAYGNDQDSINAFGIDFISELCEKLIALGAPSLHFYTMNQVDPTQQIIKNLKG